METSLFEKIYGSIDLQERSNYLKQLLESSSSLRSAFLDIYNKQGEAIRLQTKAVYNKDEALKEIRKLALEVKELLEELDFEEPDWDRWHNNSGHYMEDYKIAAILAEEEAEELFEDYSTEFKYKLLHENFYDIALNISWLLHGIIQSDINDPNYDLADPPNDYFINATNKVAEDNLAEYQRRKFQAEDYAYGFELILLTSQWHPENNNFMEAVAPFLINTINNRETASIFWSLVTAYGISLKKLPALLHHVTIKLENEQLWLENMKETFLEDYKNSVLLMDHYFKHNRETFEENASMLYKRFNNISVQYLVNKIRKGSGLHIELLKEMAGSDSTLRYFNELKNYIDEETLKEYITGIENINLKAKLLGSEKMYDELESLIRNETRNNYGLISFDFINAIRPFFVAKPGLAFELVSLKINHLMHNARNRDTYRLIAGMLRESSGITGHEKEINGIVLALYFQQKPPLPALKDELRKAGLIDTKTSK